MSRTSAREYRFLVTQAAWALAMTGDYATWSAAAPKLVGPDGGPAAITDSQLAAALDRVCTLTAQAVQLHQRAAPEGGSDEELIWAAITNQHLAYWLRDRTAFAAVHWQHPMFQFASWVNSGGLTQRVGWQAFWEAFGQDVQHFPLPNRYNAYLAKRENEHIRIADTMAWATFDLDCGVAELPGFNGLGISHEVRILERDPQGWKISLVVTLDDQFGQTDAAIWEVDIDGRVLHSNFLAKAKSSATSDVTIRAGRLGLKGSRNNEQLRRTIRAAGEVGHGIFSRYRARSMIYQPTDSSPFRVLWVVNQGSRILVTVVDQLVFENRLETAISAYGLSPAQTVLVKALLNGATLSAAARAEGISVTTARTQLQRVFEKIGVRTQSGLIGALVSAVEHAPMD